MPVQLIRVFTVLKSFGGVNLYLLIYPPHITWGAARPFLFRHYNNMRRSDGSPPTVDPCDYAGELENFRTENQHCFCSIYALLAILLSLKERHLSIVAQRVSSLLTGS